MSAFSDRSLFMIAVALYGLSALYTIFLWRRGFRADNRFTYTILTAAFCFHTAAMIQRGFSLSRCPVNNLYEAVMFVSWTTLTICLAIGASARLRFLGAFASPLLFAVGVFGLMPALDAPYGDTPTFVNGWASLHASLILLAYGAFALSAVAGLMYLVQERNLKHHKLQAVLSRFPPIQRLESVTSRLLLSGFVLLTAGLIIGAVYLKHTNGVFYTNDAKVVWSILVWLIYTALLVMRWPLAHGGRRFIWGVVGSFTFVLLTFWGTNLLSGIHQN